MKTFIKVLMVLFTISLFQNFAFSQWVSTTSGTANFLTTVQIINSNLIYACGFGGTVLRSTNTGVTWSPLTSPDAGNINSIFFPPAGNGITGWAASASGIYKSTNGGLNWVQQIAGTGTSFLDMYFRDLNTGIVLSHLSALRRTTNGGTNFTTISFSSNPAMRGTAISIGNLQIYFIIGHNAAADSSFIFRSINAGISWSQIAQLPVHYHAMSFINANTGIICGTGGSMKRTTDGGTNWSTINSGVTTTLLGIKFITSAKVYAVGFGGKILKSTDAGISWVTQVSNTSANLRGLDIMPADDNGIVCGAGGTILRTTNGGSIPTGLVYNSNEIPERFSLNQNYPNPFNPLTKIKFSVAITGYISIRVFDVMGKEIAGIVNQNLTPGIYTADFDASSLPSGTYFYRLTAGSFTDTKKMILVK